LHAVLIAGAFAVGAGDLLLLVVCWRSGTALAGVLGLIGLALAVWALAAGPDSSSGKLALAGALVALVLGSCLFAAGKALTRLLAEPEEQVVDPRRANGRDRHLRR
jgi:hypothetical protein